MKVKFFDIRLLKSTGAFFLLEGSILGTFAIFFNDYIVDNKKIIILIFVIVFVLFHVIRFFYYSNLKKISLKIKNSTFKIKLGDIFEQKDLKVINFNEYFDTIVDDKLIAKNSLNGKFILNEVDNVKELDLIIEEELKDAVKEVSSARKNGKIKKYELGSTVLYKDYILTALTKFDDYNRANLSLRDYLVFLMNFWDNLDKIYANRSVCITLFGSSSITRFKDTNDITDQDLVEIILWTFKVSKIKFKYPTTITLILTNDLLNKINLYELKERYKDGI